MRNERYGQLGGGAIACVQRTQGVLPRLMSEPARLWRRVWSHPWMAPESTHLELEQSWWGEQHTAVWESLGFSPLGVRCSTKRLVHARETECWVDETSVVTLKAVRRFRESKGEVVVFVRPAVILSTYLSDGRVVTTWPSDSDPLVLEGPRRVGAIGTDDLGPDYLSHLGRVDELCVAGVEPLGVGDLTDVDALGHYYARQIASAAIAKISLGKCMPSVLGQLSIGLAWLIASSIAGRAHWLFQLGVFSAWTSFAVGATFRMPSLPELMPGERGYRRHCTTCGRGCDGSISYCPNDGTKLSKIR